MKVTRKDLIGLFLALGVDTADEWDDAKLRTKFEGGIRKFREGDAPLAEEARETLFNDLVAAQEAGTAVEITDGADAAGETTPERNGPAVKAPAAKKKKAGGKKKGKAKAAPAAKKETKKKAAPAERTSKAWDPESGKPRPFSDRGPGITQFLVGVLQKAGEGKKDKEGVPVGISKEGALAKMVVKFPDHKEAKLATTLANQVPTRLRQVRHIHVQRNPATGGYYVVGDGRAKPKYPARRGRPAAVPA